MRSVLRIALLTAGIVFGVEAVAHAQQPDSVFVVRHQGKRLLRLNTDGGFFVQGEDGVGQIPVEGAGTRMMWYPARGAFRAGVLTPDCCANYWDAAQIGYGSVALGVNALASGDVSFAVGHSAAATGPGSVALGPFSIASGDTSFAIMGSATGRGTVAIGLRSVAEGEYSVAVGVGAVATDEVTTAIGPGAYATGYATTALGAGSRASGLHSIAIGWNAATNWKRGAIVFSDYCSELPSDSVYATDDNQFVVRACGGYKLYTDAASTTGVEVAPGGGSWSSISDVNRKENFEPLDGEVVLRRLREVPVTTWNYRTQDASIRHAGPTAQDFYAAFGLGESEQLINTVDIDGINMAAIKALEERTTRQQERIEALEEQTDRQRARIEELEAELAEHRRRIEMLEKRAERLEQLRRDSNGAPRM